MLTLLKERAAVATIHPIDRELSTAVLPSLRVMLPDHDFDVSATDGVRSAIAMLRAGEVSRRQFFELCAESTAERHADRDLTEGEK